MAALGTFSAGANSVTLSRGRGAAKTVVLDVSFRELEVWAARNGVEAKRVWTRAYGRAITSIKGKLQKVVSHAGGVEGVPKFKDFERFTRELRQARNNTKPMGGVLADKRVIIAKKVGKTQYIGWPDRLAQWAVKFQDAEPRTAIFTSEMSRHYLHRLGIKDIPHDYVSNPRQVLPEPFGRFVEKYLDEWATNIYYKDLARQMAKKKGI